MRVHFGDFVLDRATRQLLKDGEARPLEPKAYELLDLLISRRPAAVSKQEIRDALWPDTFVSESHLSSLAARVRRALDAGGEGPSSMRTVHGFGYAFGAEATEEENRLRPGSAVAQIEWERGVLRLMEGENVIGRGEEVAVRIDVEGVSRRHARILAVPAGNSPSRTWGAKTARSSATSGWRGPSCSRKAMCLPPRPDGSGFPCSA